MAVASAGGGAGATGARVAADLVTEAIVVAVALVGACDPLPRVGAGVSSQAVGAVVGTRVLLESTVNEVAVARAFHTVGAGSRRLAINAAAAHRADYRPRAMSQALSTGLITTAPVAPLRDVAITLERKAL